jgi:hypothetical protein
MTIAETLAEMRELMRKRSNLQDRITRAESAATSASVSLDGMPKSPSGESRLERCALYLADLRAEMEQIDRKLAIYTEDIRRALPRVRDTRDSEILRMRYVEHLPVRQIAERMNYERKWLYGLLRKAESEIA